MDTGTVTGKVGIEAVKEVVDTTSIDDNPVLTKVVAEEGCNAPCNSTKVTVPTPFANGGELTITPSSAPTG